MNDIFTEIMDNAIESINNQNRLMANAAQIKQLESEIAELRANLRAIDFAIESINNQNRLMANAARIKQLESEIAELRANLRAIDFSVDGYVDGAPDCNAVSKLANEVSAIIHPI